jgi:hypothetical protein
MPLRQLLTFVLCLILLAWPLAQPVSSDCGLANFDFEGGFSDRYGDGHVLVAEGWEFWYQDGPGQDEGKNWRPTYLREDASNLEGLRVHSGRGSQKMGNLYASHNAGLYQRVGVQPGSKVTFTVWAQAWSSSKDDNYSVSKPGDYRVSVGIDPTGGTNWAASTVRWSEPRQEYNTWMQLSVSAQAEADAVTVFLRGQAEYAVKHNESAWDDACLEIVRPTPRPTNTPQPTSTPTITPTSTATPTPTASPTPVAADVCAQGFDDVNGNGVPDAGEEAIPGASVTLLDAAQAGVASLMTTGNEEPACAKSVPAGDYTLKVAPPAGYVATGPQEQNLTLAGAPVSLQLSFQRVATATPEAAQPDQPSPEPTVVPSANAGPSLLSVLGRGLYNVSGILTALLAVALLVALRYARAVE